MTTLARKSDDFDAYVQDLIHEIPYGINSSTSLMKWNQIYINLREKHDQMRHAIIGMQLLILPPKKELNEHSICENMWKGIKKPCMYHCKCRRERCTCVINPHTNLTRGNKRKHENPVKEDNKRTKVRKPCWNKYMCRSENCTCTVPIPEPSSYIKCICINCN